MKIIGLLLGLLIATALICGCSAPTQDEDYKRLIENVSADFKGMEEVIQKPYQGMTANELRQYKAAALSAQAAAGALDDGNSESRPIKMPKASENDVSLLTV